MDDRSSSRELSERLELDFHRRPNRLRRMSYRAAGLLCLITFAWLAFAFARGNHRIYEGGPVSTPHQLVANDCAACHTTWSTLNRLTSFDPHVSTVDDKKCLSCHEVGLHHANQPRQQSRFDSELAFQNALAVAQHGESVLPRSDFIQGELRCAHCHREHQGRAALADVTNQHCVECHGDLETTSGPSETFVASIKRFDNASSRGAHPEFAWARLIRDSAEARAETRGHENTHHVFQVIQELTRNELDQVVDDADATGKWQDAARIRFNHHTHLQPGLIGADLRPLQATLQCSRCHETAADGRYMRPIQYEKHCAECHSLTFDIDAPGEVVPHESPEIVRGFLTEHYTFKKLSSADDTDAPAGEPSPAPARPLPGRGEGRLTQSQARAVLEAVEQSERAARDGSPESQVASGEEQNSRHTRLLFNNKAGCRYCHEVRSDEVRWSIVQPSIPDRWMAHSRFRHDTHRMLSCVSCHPGVNESQSTGDVLLPAIDVCRKCHDSKPDFALIAAHHELRGEGHSRAAARTSCVECHGYHGHVGQSSGGVYTWQSSSGDGE